MNNRTEPSSPPSSGTPLATLCTNGNIGPVISAFQSAGATAGTLDVVPCQAMLTSFAITSTESDGSVANLNSDTYSESATAPAPAICLTESGYASFQMPGWSDNGLAFAFCRGKMDICKYGSQFP